MAATESQQVMVQQPQPVTQQQQKYIGPGGGGGDGGGRRDRGRDLPEFPKDESLYAFLVFVHDLLAVWQRDVQERTVEFRELDADDVAMLRDGWNHFDGEWQRSQVELRQAVQALDVQELSRRGLSADAYVMKRHFIRKWRNRLSEARRAVAEQIQLRPLWRKLFLSADVVLDSAERALNVVPVAGAIVSGLKEFKETAMGVTEDG